MASIYPVEPASARASSPPTGSEAAAADAGQESLIILESLLCLLREKNMLSRGDIEELSLKVQRRATGESQNPLPCCSQSAAEASGLMDRLTSYIGHRYGGKHSRRSR